MKLFVITVKTVDEKGKPYKRKYDQVGTDYGNACRRFLCEHDMRDSEICGIEYLGRATRLDV